MLLHTMRKHFLPPTVRSFAVCFLTLLIFSSIETRAATISARSPSLADVSTAIAAASNGDTVIVPAGTASWTAPLDIAKAITLKGTTSTFDGFPPDAPIGSPAPANDGTIILNNSGTYIIKITVSPNQTAVTRLSGFTFRPGTVAVRDNTGGIRLEGISATANVRVDHCHFDQVHQGSDIHTYGCVFGVADHNIFDCTGASFTALIWHNSWGGKANGDGSWAEQSNWGSEKFMFFENNITRNMVPGGEQTNGCIDSKMGGRYVIRYNRVYNSTLSSGHGLEGAPQRSQRAIEIYNNVFNWTKGAGAGLIRGGALLFHDNTYTGVHLNNGFGLAVYREDVPFAGFGGANGKNAWDQNDPVLYASGTHTGANGATTLTDASKHWATNQWVGYVITNLDQHHDVVPYNSARITGNTANTISFVVNKSTTSFFPYLTFNNGAHYEIRKVLAALDQPGRGKGDLISSTSAPVWPRQESDPVYSWNNKQLPGNTDVNVQSSYPSILQGRDFFINTAKPGYKAYVYPHPLVSGAAAPSPTPTPTATPAGTPNPPTGLTVVPGP